MHIITIEKGAAGKFNVLLNGHSYRIHRNLSENRAVEVAEDARRQFKKRALSTSKIRRVICRGADSQPLRTPENPKPQKYLTLRREATDHVPKPLL